MQFVLNLVNSIVSCIAALVGVALADRMSRRNVLVGGTIASAIMLAINGGLSAKWAQMPADNKDIKVGQGAVAAFFFFNIVYSFSYTPLQGLYPVECLQTTARAKGMAMYGVVVNVFGSCKMTRNAMGYLVNFRHDHQALLTSSVAQSLSKTYSTNMSSYVL